MKLLSFNLFLYFLFSGLNGQLVYDLDECIRTGLENNFSILIAKNSETIARNNHTVGNAGFLPSFDINGRHGGNMTDTKRNLTDGSQTVSEGEFNTTTTAGLSMNLTIFNGFNVQTTYRKLDELKQIGELNTQMAIENLVADIIVGYYSYIQHLELLNNLKYAVELSKERLRIDEDRYLLGSSSKLQVLQSRVYLNADSSRLSRQYEVVREAQIRLNELMAVEDLGRSFTTKDSSVTLNHDLLFEKLLEETLSRNTTLLIAVKNKTISEYDYKIIQSRSYPYLTASSGYNYSVSTYTANQAKNQLSNGFNYGLTFGVNIFDGFNQRRSLRNSSIEIKNKELKYQEIEQGVRADLITIYSAYTNYLRLIELETQNLQTASENLEIAMERYKLGNLSGIDLRDVQKSRLDARESLLSVESQAKLAEISLLLISGRIMEYF